MAIPDELLERFRTLSVERLGRVEAMWNGLVQNLDEDETARQIACDVHTLKGDAAIVGFLEVQILCQKLEDLLALAEDQRYEISEDFELVVTMAIQFVGMLLRKKRGSSMTGLDLPGFVRQVDDVLRESRAAPVPLGRARRASTRPASSEALRDRLSEATRQRLATAATSAFLEYLSARGTSSRQRLRGVWHTLKHELARMQVTELRPVLEYHATGASELASAAGKRLAVQLELTSACVDPRVAEAIDAAVVHVMRGPSERAMLRVRTIESTGAIEIAFEDDSRGLDGAAVDAIRAALARVGGTVRTRSKAAGHCVSLTVPAPLRHLHVYQFLAPGGAVSLAVSARWTPTSEPMPAPDAVDPLHTIQLFGSSRQTSVHPPTPMRDLGLRLRWGFLEVSLRSSTEPRLVTGERICPTPDDHPVEVIAIDGQETLMLRPEHVAELAAAWSGRSASIH